MGISNHALQKWNVCGRKEPIMDISSTGSQMESPRQMRMIVLVDLMRAYGDNLERMIVPLYMCSVCAPKYLIEKEKKLMDQ